MSDLGFVIADRDLESRQPHGFAATAQSGWSVNVLAFDSAADAGRFLDRINRRYYRPLGLSASDIEKSEYRRGSVVWYLGLGEASASLRRQFATCADRAAAASS
jgi:hypothetical protein